MYKLYAHAVDSCPTGAIMAYNDMRRHAVIHYPDCAGCGECQKVCLFDAIAGSENSRRSGHRMELHGLWQVRGGLSSRLRAAP